MIQLSRCLCGLAQSSVLGLKVQGYTGSLLSRYQLSLAQSCIVGVMIEEHMVSLLSRYLLGLSESSNVGLQIQGHMVTPPPVKVPPWPSAELSFWSLGIRAHGDPAVQVLAWFTRELFFDVQFGGHMVSLV